MAVLLNAAVVGSWCNRHGRSPRSGQSLLAITCSCAVVASASHGCVGHVCLHCSMSLYNWLCCLYASLCSACSPAVCEHAVLISGLSKTRLTCSMNAGVAGLFILTNGCTVSMPSH